MSTAQEQLAALPESIEGKDQNKLSQKKLEHANDKMKLNKDSKPYSKILLNGPNISKRAAYKKIHGPRPIMLSIYVMDLNINYCCPKTTVGRPIPMI